MLVNYRVDPDVIARVLPAPFRPQLLGDAAIAGICLIRLGEMRPVGVPRALGMRSENAAHRIAVEWDGPHGPQTGVYIPRRDSNSWTNIMLGGRFFPGEHNRARFEVEEASADLRVSYASVDGSTQVDAAVHITDRLTGSRLFADLDDASAFFKTGSVGYSSTRSPRRFDGLELQTSAWKVEPALVTDAHSSFFEDASNFPTGTAELDCALVMRDVPVQWEPLADLHSEPERIA